MTRRFFVMLRMDGGKPAAMVEDNEEVALFGSESEADEAALQSPLGHANGWQTYEWWTEDRAL